MFCVASLATLPLASFVSLAATISAPSQPPHAPAAINLQVLFQPMIADAVQRAFHDLASPSFASAYAPSSLSAAYIQPSSSSSQAPSSLGESLHFPSFVSTICLSCYCLCLVIVCLVTRMPPSPFVSTLTLFTANSTLASPVQSHYSSVVPITCLIRHRSARSPGATAALYAVFLHWAPRF